MKLYMSEITKHDQEYYSFEYRYDHDEASHIVTAKSLEHAQLAQREIENICASVNAHELNKLGILNGNIFT